MCNIVVSSSAFALIINYVLKVCPEIAILIVNESNFATFIYYLTRTFGTECF